MRAEVNTNGFDPGGLNGRNPAILATEKLKQPASANEPLTFRQAPHNHEAEQALLGAILVDNAALARVPFIEAEHFYDPLHGRIFETLTTLIRAGETATPITVKTFFENVEPIDANMSVPQYLGKLAANATTIINAASYGRTIYDLAAKRLLIAVGEAIVSSAYECSDAAETPTHIIARARNHLTTAEEKTHALRTTSLLAYAGEATLPAGGRYLIKHLLSRSSVAALYGPSTPGKTFYALDLAFRIALGLSLHGRRVAKNPVLYIVLEGQADFGKRVIAARKTLGDPGRMFATLNVPVSLGADAAGEMAVATIIAAALEMQKATRQKLGLIVIDTLARAIGGDNENEAHAISAFLAKIDRIRAATGAAVLLIHHPGKNEALGMRGSSALFAAMDTVLRIEREKDTPERSVIVEKAKDGIEGPLQTYTLQSVSLGVDDEGDEITSCAIETSQRSASLKRNRPASSSGSGKALSELEHLVIDGKAVTCGAHRRIPFGTKLINRDEFRTACLSKGLTATRKPDAEKQAFNRAFRDLERSGWLGSFEDSVWLIGDNPAGAENAE